MKAMASEKVTVISGCSSGIGLETAVLLAKTNGYKVIATMRNLQKREALEKAAGETLNKSLFIKELDISKEESILKFIEDTYAKEGRIDVLINNAGIVQFGAFENFTMEQMHRIFQTNFFGTAKITQEVVRRMKQQRSGHIIFLSSMTGFRPVPFMEFYTASKHALEGMIGALAPILQFFNVRVTSIQPGPVDTSIPENMKKNKMGTETVFDVDTIRDPDTDEMTNTLKDNMKKSFGKSMAEQMQSGEDVAQIIKKCIEDDIPQLKVQTSALMEGLVKDTFTDPTGDNVTSSMVALMQ